MTTADDLKEKALRHAEEGTPLDEAVADLLSCCADKRLSVVKARQEISELQGDDNATRAVELLDAVLERGDWAA